MKQAGIMKSFKDIIIGCSPVEKPLLVISEVTAIFENCQEDKTIKIRPFLHIRFQIVGVRTAYHGVNPTYF
jgi:hypothetical protein